jgi:hypothetical protein
MATDLNYSTEICTAEELNLFRKLNLARQKLALRTNTTNEHQQNITEKSIDEINLFRKLDVTRQKLALRTTTTAATNEDDYITERWKDESDLLRRLDAAGRNLFYKLLLLLLMLCQ